MLKTFNAPFIFWTEVPNHKEIKDYLFPQIKNLYYKNKEDYTIQWKSYVYTSFNYPNDFLKEDWIIKSIVWEPLDKMFSEIELTLQPRESNIRKIWWNYYPEGGYQEAHNHEGTYTTFSAVYLLDINEKNNTIFTDLSQIFYLQKEHHTEDIKEGSVIIFPPNLLHYVIPSKKERCTISYNISTNFN